MSVGTDHHPFDRLIDWADRWLATVAPEDVRCVVQSGASRPPELAEVHDYVSNEQLQTWMEQAVAVISHGGPGTIMDCRRAGSIPIVVPRRSALKEHVDDHQVAFARRMAAAGLILLADTEDELHDHLRGVLDDQEETARIDVDVPGDAVDAFERLVTSRLLSEPAPRRSWKRRWRRHAAR